MTTSAISQALLLEAAGRRWMNDHGACVQHGLVESGHRCRDYDGHVFGKGYASQGWQAAVPFLLPMHPTPQAGEP